MKSNIYLEIYDIMLKRGGAPEYSPTVMTDYMASFAVRFNKMSGRQRYIEMKKTIEDFADQPDINRREVLGLINLLRWMILKKQLKRIYFEMIHIGKGLNKVLHYRII